MTYRTIIKLQSLSCFAALLFLGGCGQDKVIIFTGTQIGLEASPGDGNTQAPSVSFAYKRGEFALVPVAKTPATGSESTKSDPKRVKDSNTENTDAYSTLATFNLAHNWFGPTKIEQFIATGHAARAIQKKDSAFAEKLVSGNPD